MDYESLLPSGHLAGHFSAQHDRLDISAADQAEQDVSAATAIAQHLQAAADAAAEADEENDESDGTKLHMMAGDPGQTPAIKRTTNGSRLTVREREVRKERQKSQNRKAAERSRYKKRSAQDALEGQVGDERAENVRLRARLAELRGEEPRSPPLHVNPALSLDPSSSSAPQAGTGIDFTYLQKIQKELLGSKILLLERQFQLAELRSHERVFDPKAEATRQSMLKHQSALGLLKAEEESMRMIIDSLGSERENLRKQLRVIRVVLAKRRGEVLADDTDVENDSIVDDLEAIAVEKESGSAQESDHRDRLGEDFAGKRVDNDEALDDIRGWMDAAVKDWDGVTQDV